MTHRIQHRVVRLIVRAALLAGLTLAWHPWGLAAEMRTWTDASGQHTLEAALLRVEGEKIFLQRRDGTKYQIERGKLSQADQQYVAAHAPSESEAPAASDPFASAGSDQWGPGKEVPTVGKTAEFVKIDWSTAKAVALEPQGAWQLTVPQAAEETPSRRLPAAASARKTHAIPPNRQGWEKLTAIVSNRVCHCALIGYALENAPAGCETRLVLCDLQNGRVAQGLGADTMVPLSLSDRGDQVLLRSDSRRNAGRLEVWALTPSGIQRGAAWYPYGESELAASEVRWGALLDGGRVATAGNGRLALWSLDPPKPLCYAPIHDRCTPSLSPDRKYLVFAARDQIRVLDLKTFDVVAAQAMPPSFEPIFAVSPGGTRLAMTGQDAIHTWDFASGGHQHAIKLSGTGVWGELFWTSERHLLVGKETLFDADKEVKLWRYEGGKAVTFCDGTCWFLLEAWARTPGGLVPLRLPHREALESLADAMPQYAAKAGIAEALGRSRVTVSGLSDVNSMPLPRPRAR